MGLWLAEAAGLRLSFRGDSVISIVYADKAPDFRAIEHIPVVFREFAQPPE